MFRHQIACLLAASLLLLNPLGCAAAEVDAGEVYCFSAGDWDEQITGICITQLPEAGALMLGHRVLQPGDVLTGEQAAQLTFCPPDSPEDASAELGYLPIYSHRVDPAAVLTIAIRGKEDKAPVAEDGAMETYRDLPATGRLKVSDPEGQEMTFTVTRQPKRGTVEILSDGSFTYTPKKNKVGIDSFRYTAADPAGNVSREATVTVTIAKPSDAPRYTDTLGRDCRFAAEWMKHTGIFVGETVANNPCFSPDRQVTRGEFVTMLVNALQLPTEEEAHFTGYTDEIPLWLQPYLAAAVRSGLTAGLPDQQTFGPDIPITGAEAAVMLHNALDLPVATAAETEDAAVPGWAATAVNTLQSSGILLTADAPVSRAQAAMALYRAAQLQSESIFDSRA